MTVRFAKQSPQMPTTTREAAWGVIIAVVLANLALVMLSQFVSPFRSLVHISGPWLPVTLMVAADFLLVVGVLMFAVGRLRPADIGLARRGAWNGAAFAVALWVILQLVLCVMGFGDARSLAVAGWVRETPGETLGRAFYDLSGTALFEEIVFRGFLLQQLWLKFGGANRRRRFGGFLMALVVSQGVFAASHVPERIDAGVSYAALPADMLVLFVWGVLFSLVFVAGGNLVYSVGAHALIVAPLPIVDSSESSALIVQTSIVVWLTAIGLWRWLQFRRVRRRVER